MLTKAFEQKWISLKLWHHCIEMSTSPARIAMVGESWQLEKEGSKYHANYMLEEACCALSVLHWLIDHIKTSVQQSPSCTACPVPAFFSSWHCIVRVVYQTCGTIFALTTFSEPTKAS